MLSSFCLYLLCWRIMSLCQKIVNKNVLQESGHKQDCYGWSFIHCTFSVLSVLLTNFNIEWRKLLLKHNFNILFATYAFQVVRMVVSTYQAASGAGAAAMEELKLQTREVFAFVFMYTFCFSLDTLHLVTVNNHIGSTAFLSTLQSCLFLCFFFLLSFLRY